MVRSYDNQVGTGQPLQGIMLAYVVIKKDENIVATILSLLIQGIQLIHKHVALCLSFRFFEDLVDRGFVEVKLASNNAMCSAIVEVVERNNAGFELPGKIISSFPLPVQL